MGVRVGFSLVNSVSNQLVSLGFLSVGRKGGATRLLNMSSQLMSRKKGWALTSSASVGPAPSRLVGSRVRSCKERRKTSKQYVSFVYSSFLFWEVQTHLVKYRD